MLAHATSGRKGVKMLHSYSPALLISLLGKRYAKDNRANSRKHQTGVETNSKPLTALKTFYFK